MQSRVSPWAQRECLSWDRDPYVGRALSVVQGCVPYAEGDVSGFIIVLERAPSDPVWGTVSAKAEVGMAKGRWEAWVGLMSGWEGAGGMVHGRE